MPVTQLLSVVGRTGGGGPTPPTVFSTFFGDQWLYTGRDSTPALAPAGTYTKVTDTSNSNTTTYYDGNSYTVADFDGTNSSWTTGNLNSNGLLTNTYSITIEAWIVPVATGMVVLSEWGQGTGPTWHASAVEINSDNTVSARLWNGAQVTSTATVNQAAWNHIYVQYNSDTSTLTLNVNNSGSPTVQTGYTRASNYASGGSVYFNVGAAEITSFNSGRFRGLLGELRINNWAAPSSYWAGAKKYLNLGGTVVTDANLKFDLQGTTAPSGGGFTWASTVNGRSATLYNTPVYNTTPACYTFSNTSYASVSGEGDNLGTINTAPAQTMTMWANITQADQYQAIAGFRPEGSYNFYLLLLSPGHGSPTYGTEFRVGTANGYTDNVQPYINLFGRWTHITCIADGTQTRIYFNGRLAGYATISGNFGSNTGSFDIASSFWQSAGTSIAEIQFYNRVLTDDEVVRNYATNKLRLGL